MMLLSVLFVTADAATYYSKLTATNAAAAASWTTSSTGSGGSSATAGAFAATGNTFTILSGVTFSSTTNWTLNSALVITGNLTLGGSGSANLAAVTVGTTGNFTVSSSVAILVDNLSVLAGGKLTHNQNYSSPTYLDVAGDLNILGSYIYTGYTPAITMTTAGTHFINTGTTSLYKLLLRLGDFKASGNVVVNDEFYAMWSVSGGSFHTNGNNVTANWGMVNNGGTIYVDGGSLTVNGAIGGILLGNGISLPGSLLVNSGTLTTVGLNIGTIMPSNCILNGGTLMVNANGITIGQLSSFTHVLGTNTINGPLNIATLTSAYKHTNTTGTTILNVNGTITNSGTYSTSTGAATLNIGGNWVNNNTFTSSNTNTVTFNGTANQTIGGTAGNTFYNLVISPAAGVTVSPVTSNVSIINNLTVNSGTYDLATVSSNRSLSGGGTFTLAAGAKLRLGNATGGDAGSNFPSNFATYTFDGASTTEYYGVAQGISALPSYGHLSLINAGLKKAKAGTTTIKGDFTVTSSATFDANGGTISLAGSTAQNFAGVNYASLTLAGNSTKTLSAPASVQTLLKIISGTTLALNNNDMTLRSNATTTASVSALATGAITYGTGAFIVERYLPAKKAWRFVSAPVAAGQKIFDTWQEAGVATSGNGVQITGPGAAPATNGLDVTTGSASMKWFNGATNAYVTVTNTRTTNLSNDQGYMIYVRGDRTSTIASGTNTVTTLRTKGQLNIGTKSYAVGAAKYASVGNPYASRIDMTQVYANGGFSGVTNSFTIWDPVVGSGTYGQGLYRTYTRNTATGNFELTPGGAVNNVVESGQAFFIQSTTGGTFSVDENAKTSGSSATSKLTDHSELKRFHTNLYSVLSDGSDTLIDGTLTDIDETYSNSIDNMDVRKTLNATENISIISGSNNLIVERRSPFATETVFYSISAMKQQQYHLEFVPENAPAAIGVTAYLKDAFLNTSTSISLDEPTKISFTITPDAASYAGNRFMLVFKQAVVLPVTFTSISANRTADRTTNIKWTIENERNIEKYTVERSTDGRTFTAVAYKVPTNVNAYTQKDELPLAGDNYYRVKALSIDGKIEYSAVVKVAIERAGSGISVYQNPVVNKTVQVQFTNQPAGVYNLQMSNSGGQVIYKGAVKINDGVSATSIKLPPATAAGVYQLKVGNDQTTQTISILVNE